MVCLCYSVGLWVWVQHCRHLIFNLSFGEQDGSRKLEPQRQWQKIWRMRCTMGQTHPTCWVFTSSSATISRRLLWSVFRESLCKGFVAIRIVTALVCRSLILRHVMDYALLRPVSSSVLRGVACQPLAGGKLRLSRHSAMGRFCDFKMLIFGPLVLRCPYRLQRWAQVMTSKILNPLESSSY